MTGEEHVHIQVIGSTNDDVTRVAQPLDDLGHVVTDDILLREEYNQLSVYIDA